MIVNRPYVVVIHDTKSGVVLFMGKIVDPPPIISQPPVAGALFDSGQKR